MPMPGRDDTGTIEDVAGAYDELVHIKNVAAWNRGRARGQRERFNRIRSCAVRAEKLKVTCVECGDQREGHIRCDVSRVCASCRARRAWLGKARFGEARQAAVGRARSAGLLGAYRRGGRWSEKFLTVTVPHRGDTKHRIDVLFEAWRTFSRWFQKSWRELPGSHGVKPAFHRSFEWTPGNDGLGHPHFHVWLLCPFLPYKDARAVWRTALEHAGMVLDDDEPTIIHISEVRTRPAEFGHELLKGADAVRFAKLDIGGEDVFEYATGWSIVDVARDGRVDPTVERDLYITLEGRRLTQGSRGFLLPRIARCPSCGVHEPRVYAVRTTAGNADAREGPQVSTSCACVASPRSRQAAWALD
jgi:hypothetical protein